MNERQQITASKYGTSLIGEFGFDNYGLPMHIKAKVGTTYRQDYRYDFNGYTRNLTTRTNGLKTETFGYDTGNLDRLVSVTGTSAQTIGYDPTIKGNITSKTDVGNYTYYPTRKYAVQTITNGLNISTTPQSIVYNAFNKVQTITEGTKTAEFVYNADRQRIRMTLKTSGTTTKTRYYFGGSCEREVVGSATTQYIWIGGDAYTAVAVAKKTGTGSWAVYNIFRDHLGTITHLKTGSTITEYSFDAWGRRRNALNWSYDLTGQPALFADRGFTGHEFLADFNLYNMNGRLYDPVVGRFLSPDPYITDPSFSQSYNRYSYALNNPLKFTDYSGESWKSFWNKIGNWLTRNNIKFQVGYNSTFGPGFSFGDNPMYYPGYENKIVDGQRNISNQIAGFSGMGANTGSPIFGNGDVINQQFVGESVQSGGGAASGLAAGWAIGLAEPTPAGEIVMGIATSVAVMYYGPDIVKKMQTEIDNIMTKSAGPQGFVYELRATRSGPYPNLNTGSTTFLNVGDVWKYGQTTIGESRYSRNFYETMGLRMYPIFPGNQMEILIQEKIMIYGYFFMYGHRPPGNPIFR